MGLHFVFMDTHVLSDILRQFNPMYPNSPVSQSAFLSSDMVRILNPIVQEPNINGIAIVSSFAFIELINKFDQIFRKGELKIERLSAFLQQPPEWLIIEDVNIETAFHSCEVPESVLGKGISVDDAVHVATAIQRGDPIYFFTSDTKLLELEIKNISFIT